MFSNNTEDIFLAIVRQGIVTYPFGRIVYSDKNQTIDWDAIESLAAQHGLSAVVVDGIERLPEEQRPPKEVLLQWIGETLQSFEYRYNLYLKTISEMAGWYNAHGYKMMVLKGFACALDWPKPEHRPCGDIDIWLFGKSQEADAILAKEKGVKIDKSHHHHTVFDWRDFMVENHYDFINIHHHESNIEFEKILKELASDDSYVVEVYGEKVYLPSPNLHALFLLKHTMIHFAAEGISLRQLIDWGFFVKAHGKNVDWKMVMDVLERFGMKDLFNIINAICVEDMGFDANIFPQVQFNPVLKDRVLKEILSPEFPNQTPHGLFKRVSFKLRRWKGNAWKHELCYKESMWSAFWSGVWNHLLKPSSI